MTIITIDSKKNEKFLRKKTKSVDLARLKELNLPALVRDMKVMMRRADGVGLSANQIGLDMKLFVAEVPAERAHGTTKFYAILNPEIVKRGGELVELEEGCLSVPGVFGPVDRTDRITVSGFDLKGRRLKIKAWGFLARVFQHEIDHLNGILFVDKAKNLHDIPLSERLRAREAHGKQK